MVGARFPCHVIFLCIRMEEPILWKDVTWAHALHPEPKLKMAMLCSLVVRVGAVHYLQLEDLFPSTLSFLLLLLLL